MANLIHRLSEAHHRLDPALARFIEAVHAVLEETPCVTEIVPRVERLMRDLLVHWRMPDPRYLERQPGCRYGSYLLYRAPDTSFVVVIDTFDAGQSTQIHNHRTWAVVGLLEGAERSEIYRAAEGFEGPPRQVSQHVTRPGDVITMMETDMHRLYTDLGTFSRSFHVYGADVGTSRRVRWDEESQRYCEFRQGWSNDAVSLPIFMDCPVMSELELRHRCVEYLNQGSGAATATPPPAKNLPAANPR